MKLTWVIAKSTQALTIIATYVCYTYRYNYIDIDKHTLVSITYMYE